MTATTADYAIETPISSMWWVALLEGIAALIVGILLITDPTSTVVTLTIFLGVWWLIGGIFDLVKMFIDHANWGWRLASGILGIVAGLVIIRHPLWAAILLPTTVVWALGILGIAIGIINIIRVFQGGGWSSAIMGVLSLILGLLLLGSNVLAIAGLIVGIAAGCAIIGGIFAIVMAFRLRKA
jgi:uncharacterized membrane protein HdeD (DUF308 family)